MRAARLAGAACLAALLTACAPDYNWREIRADAEGVRVMLPAKPASMSRRIDLGDKPVQMTMYGARVDETSFTVGIATLATADATTSAHALAAMRAAMARNIQGKEVASTTVNVPLIDAGGESRGVVPATAIEVEGSMKGRPARMLARFSAFGDRAYQWVVLGYDIDDEQAQTFLESMRIEVSAPAERPG